MFVDRSVGVMNTTSTGGLNGRPRCRGGRPIAHDMPMESVFQLIEPDDVIIDGSPSAGMTIRAAGRPLGQLSGFVIDRAEQEIRYMVVRASGLFKRSRLVPFATPRVDVEGHAIDLDIDERELRQLRNFTPEQLLTV